MNVVVVDWNNGYQVSRDRFERVSRSFSISVGGIEPSEFMH